MDSCCLVIGDELADEGRQIADNAARIGSGTGDAAVLSPVGKSTASSVGSPTPTRGELCAKSAPR